MLERLRAALSRNHTPRCSVCGRTSDDILKQIGHGTSVGPARIVAIGNPIGVCPLCRKWFCSESALPPDPSVALQNARCPSDEVELDFYWDEPPSEEAPWRLGATEGKVPTADEVPPKFDVALNAVCDRRLPVIKVVAEATGLGVKEAKAVVDGPPKPLKETVTRHEAETLKRKIEDAGGTAEIRVAGTRGPLPDSSLRDHQSP